MVNWCGCLTPFRSHHPSPRLAASQGAGSDEHHVCKVALLVRLHLGNHLLQAAHVHPRQLLQSAHMSDHSLKEKSRKVTEDNN